MAVSVRADRSPSLPLLLSSAFGSSAIRAGAAGLQRVRTPRYICGLAGPEDLATVPQTKVADRLGNVG